MKKILALILTILMVTLAFTSCEFKLDLSSAFEPKDELETEQESEMSSDNELNSEKESEESKETETQKSDEEKESETSNSTQNSDEDLQKAYTRDGKKITFGSYPQTEVTNEALIATLNTKAGALPTAENKQAWTSYRYYTSSSNETDYMWYIDITEGGEKYRGVYFTSYRYPAGSYSSTHQDDNGYTKGTIYWFKYEPISWTILNENTTNGTALILCDMIIDSQAYQDEYEYNSTDEKYYNTSENVPEGTYAINYKYSNIRKWLNETFYETAFNELQQAPIVTTTVENGEKTTGYEEENGYACEDTQDKVFLLSCEELTNEDYGLNTTTARQKKTNDYARAQGGYTVESGNYEGNGEWWLRSHNSGDFAGAHAVFSSGNVYGTYIYGVIGVVPALQIKLS